MTEERRIQTVSHQRRAERSSPASPHSPQDSCAAKPHKSSSNWIRLLKTWATHPDKTLLTFLLASLKRRLCGSNPLGLLIYNRMATFRGEMFWYSFAVQRVVSIPSESRLWGWHQSDRIFLASASPIGWVSAAGSRKAINVVFTVISSHTDRDSQSDRGW